MRLFFLSLVLLLSSLCAPAQELSLDPDVDTSGDLPETTVESGSDPEPRTIVETEEAIQQSEVPSVATRTVLPKEKAVRVLSPSIDTLSQAELRTSQHYNLAGALRQSAGVSVVSNGGEGTVTSIFSRGSESDHTVILLNGRRLPRGLSGQYQIEFQDITNLESVQYSRGPSSSLYGSDALGGAIDLRSTDARFVESNTLSTFAEAGSFETKRSGGKITLRDGVVGIALDASFLDTNNDRPRSDFENGTVRGNVAVEIGDGIYLDVLGSIQDAFLQVPGSRFNATFPQSQTNQNQSSLFSPRFSIVRDDWDFFFYYSGTSNELVARQAPFGSDNLLSQSGEEWEAAFNFRPSDDASMTIGAGHYSFTFERSPLAPFAPPPASFEYGFTSVFVQVDLDLPHDFHLLASSRYDDQDTFKSKATYNVQLSRRFEKTGSTIFAKVATGYKVPTGQDLLFTNTLPNASNLAPEESLSFEFGLTQDLFDERATLSLVYFDNDIDNIIDNDTAVPFPLPNPLPVDTHTQGAEAEFSVAVSDQLDAYANYTYLDAIVTDGVYGFGSDRPGARMIRRPRHTLGAGIVFRTDHWELGAEINGAFDRTDRLFPAQTELKDYTVVRLFGSCYLNENIEVFGRIENALDDTYDHTRGFRAPGTGAFIGCRIVVGQ